MVSCPQPGETTAALIDAKTGETVMVSCPQPDVASGCSADIVLLLELGLVGSGAISRGSRRHFPWRWMSGEMRERHLTMRAGGGRGEVVEPVAGCSRLHHRSLRFRPHRR